MARPRKSGIALRGILSVTALAALGVAGLALAGCATATPGPAPLAHVDLNRMYGDWYIVATMPNVLERGTTDSLDHFGPGPDGSIREDFYVRRGGFNKKKDHFVVRIDVKPNTNNADWRVHPIWPLSLPFQVVYVDPNYRFAMFGEQNRKWGWIYSRERNISDADYQAHLAKFAALGWDTSKFRRTVQTYDQLGKPGFWSDGIDPSPPK
jgi:apolipoprotein D and lipocalin family protein